jgi:hypothetical protein
MMKILAENKHHLMMRQIVSLSRQRLKGILQSGSALPVLVVVVLLAPS